MIVLCSICRNGPSLSGNTYYGTYRMRRSCDIMRLEPGVLRASSNVRDDVGYQASAPRDPERTQMSALPYLSNLAYVGGASMSPSSRSWNHLSCDVFCNSFGKGLAPHAVANNQSALIGRCAHRPHRHSRESTSSGPRSEPQAFQLVLLALRPGLLLSQSPLFSSGSIFHLSPPFPSPS